MAGMISQAMIDLREAERAAEKRRRAALKGWRTRKAVNVCEHGDHPAPAGRRFCTKACQRCEESDPLPGKTCRR